MGEEVGRVIMGGGWEWGEVGRVIMGGWEWGGGWEGDSGRRLGEQ